VEDNGFRRREADTEVPALEGFYTVQAMVGISSRLDHAAAQAVSLIN
jgi:hypothetical protein